MKKILMLIASIFGAGILILRSLLAREKQGRAEDKVKVAIKSNEATQMAVDALEEGLKNESDKSDSSKHKFNS